MAFVVAGVDIARIEIHDDLLDAYPRLTREDIQAAIRYADAGW